MVAGVSKFPGLTDVVTLPDVGGGAIHATASAPAARHDTSNIAVMTIERGSMRFDYEVEPTRREDARRDARTAVCPGRYTTCCAGGPQEPGLGPQLSRRPDPRGLRVHLVASPPSTTTLTTTPVPSARRNAAAS